MAQNSGTDELMKSNIVLLAAFAMGTSAQASTLHGFGTSGISYSLAAALPEPATFVLVGFALVVLPLIRKRRG